MRAGGIWRGLALVGAIGLGASAAPPEGAPGGLLYANDFATPDAAALGPEKPSFLDRARVLPGGPHRHTYLQLADDGVIAWRAPANIYAQRGTLAFQWRARTPLGKAPFPIFRVGYGDHSSWDMTWLRLDWNGHGFD